VDNPVLDDLLQLFFGDAERGLYLIEGAYEVVPVDTKILDIVRDTGNCPNLGGRWFHLQHLSRNHTHLNVPVERKTRSALDQTTDLSTREVLGESSQFLQVNIRIHDAVVPHLGGVDSQDLVTTVLIWKGDLHVYFQTTRAQQRLINHVETVGHTNNQNVVELVDTVHLRNTVNV